jgi:tetratricopeptide (TPR) repeat protein
VDDRVLFEEALQRGNSYSWDQQWTEAISEFQVAIEEISNEPAPYAGLGMAYFELGDLKRALENYKLAARYSEGDMIYLKHVADVQERLGQLEEAGRTYMAIGEIQLRRKKLDEAVGNWLRAVRLEPNLVGGHQRLAAVYRRQGLTGDAIREYMAMARIYQARGDTDKALKTCQTALELDPRNADVLTAVDLIRQGEAIAAGGDELPAGEADVHDMAVADALDVLDPVDVDELVDLEMAGHEDKRSGPILSAQRLAQEQLAAEIFWDGETDNGATQSNGLSKLERDALVSQALDFQTRGMTDKAIGSYEKAIAGGLDSPAAHFDLGLLYQDQQRYGQAISEFERATADPEFRIGCQFALGDSYRFRGSLDKAVRSYLAALRLVDLKMLGYDNARRVEELYRYLANGLLDGSDFDGAMVFLNALDEFVSQPDWNEAVKEARERLDSLSLGKRTLILGDMLTAGSVQVLESLHLSQVYSQRGNFDTAVEEAYRVIQLSPYYMPGHIQLAELMAKQEHTRIAVTKFLTIGDTYRVRGDISGAIESYERALELSPMDQGNRARLIEMLIQHDRIDRALEHYMIMGEAFYNLAEVDKARRSYLEAIKLAHRGSADRKWRLELIRAIADIDMQRLDWKRALAAYNEIYASDPGNDSVVLVLVDLYYKVGQPKAALRQLDRHLIQLVRAGKSDQVVDLLEKAVEQWPGEAGLVDRLARVYVQQGRNQEARKLLDQLGETQLEAGQTDKAMKTLQRILDLNPPNATGYQQVLEQLRQGDVERTSAPDETF